MKHSAEERETALMLSCGIGLCALIATLIIGRALERRKIHQLPLSGVGVLLGALSAGALRWVAPLSSSHVDDDVLRDERRKQHPSMEHDVRALAQVLCLFKSACLIMDEVDLLLHPLKSELNFPIGDKVELNFDLN